MRLSPIVVLILIVAPIALMSTAGLVAADNTSNPPNNAPSLQSAFIVDGGKALVILGYPSFGNQYTQAPSGSQIYAAELWAVCYDLTPNAVKLTMDLDESGYGWNNATFTLQPDQELDIGIPFAITHSWTNVLLVMGGDGQWQGQGAVPISLLPPDIANLGGLDLLVLAVISESILAFASCVAVARWMMRRALWAPKFSLVVWGHVILIGLAGGVLLDFQQVDSVFAGWSPLVYIVFITPMFFLFSLSYFNHTRQNELLQPIARSHGRLRFRRTLVRLATLPIGDTVLVLENWSGFWARFWGHHVVLERADPEAPETFAAEVEAIVSPTQHLTRRERRKMRQASEDFEVANPQGDGTSHILIVDSAEPIVVQWPRLVIHRWVDVSATFDAEGKIVTEATQERHLSLPHYIEGSAASIHLAPIHYRNVFAVAAEWCAVADISRLQAKAETELYALKSNWRSTISARVENILVAYWAFIGRPERDLTEEEADEIAGKSVPKLANLLGENRKDAARE
jgi:hypothetical protein